MPKPKPLFVETKNSPIGSRLEQKPVPAISWTINPDLLPKQMQQTLIDLQFRQRSTKMPEFKSILRDHSTLPELRKLSNAFRQLADSLWRPAAKRGRKPDAQTQKIYKMRTEGKVAYKECFRQEGIYDPLRRASIKSSIRQMVRPKKNVRTKKSEK